MTTQEALKKLLKVHKAEELGMKLGYSKQTIIRYRDGKAIPRTGTAKAINDMANGKVQNA